MLNLFKNKKVTKKVTTKKLSIVKQIDKLSSFENISTTIESVIANRKNTYKSFIDGLLGELALGEHLEKLDIEASKQKNRNKWKHNQLAKSGFGKHSTNDKNQSTFEYTVFTRQELNIRKQANKHSNLFYNYCLEKDFTSFVYAFQNFRKDNIELFSNSENSKQASHKRKTTKQANSKKEASNELSNKSLSLEFVSNITNDKTFKDKNLETCLKDCYSFIEIYLNENGLDFEKIMKTNKSNEIETFKKIFKIAI